MNLAPTCCSTFAARCVLLAAVLCCPIALHAQTPQPAAPLPQAPEAQSVPSSKGSVLFERNTDASVPQPQTPAPEAAVVTPQVTDTERSAITITAYDLDLRLAPASSGLAMRARITVRNDGPMALAQVALQVSSTLAWESATLVADKARTRLPLVQHVLDTDADHTGKASEAVVTLPSPLAPGASLVLDTLYSGTIAQNSTRLERIGAPAAEAVKADWDAITEDATALRGFGDVLWYPVAAPPLFLGQGAQLFEAAGQMKLRESRAEVALRLAVEYSGAPPIAAYFCGRRAALAAVGGEADPPAGVTGITTATFATTPLGFRIMSLFVIPERESIADPQPGGWSLLAAATHDESQMPLVSASVEDAGTLLADWLGPQPLSVLTVIDHAGQPFEDGPLLVAPLAALAAPEAAPALTHSLTHAWVQTGVPWMDEGLAQFFVLLWTERTRGREAAVAQLTSLLQPLTLAEPALEAGKPAPAGQPLPSATGELYFRRKAAAVWWMLRDLTGDDALKLALQAWRTRPQSHNAAADDALAFEAVLEKIYGKDLHWFFDDWVLHDRGLPDLTLGDVTPRELPAAAGRSTGWLVSVTVRNEGGAVADVPVVVRSGSYSTTQRLRIAAFSTAATRIVVEAPPTEVVVNDGSTPEQRTSLHTRAIVLHGR